MSVLNATGNGGIATKPGILANITGENPAKEEITIMFTRALVRLQVLLVSDIVKKGALKWMKYWK